MTYFLAKATPILLTFILSLVGIGAILISQGNTIVAETDYKIRRDKALNLIIASLPHNLCLAAFSYDIWVVTTLFSGDEKTLQFYNIYNKQAVILILITIHVMLYVFVIAWGGVVRGASSDNKHYFPEIVAMALAIVSCILFQSY